MYDSIRPVQSDKEKSRLAQKARANALNALAERYPNEYAAFLKKAKKDLGLRTGTRKTKAQVKAEAKEAMSRDAVELRAKLHEAEVQIEKLKEFETIVGSLIASMGDDHVAG